MASPLTHSVSPEKNLTQQIATVSRLPDMPQPDHETATLERRIVSWMPSDPNQPVILTRAPNDAETAKIRHRLMILSEALEARDARSLERSVTGMLLSFPSGRAGGLEAQAIILAYVNALADLPPWAVNEAARRWTRGLVAGGNPAFPPSSAELHQVALRVVEPFQRERAMLGRVAAGIPQTGPMPTLSRERKAEIEADVQRKIASTLLETKSAELGVDFKKAMAEIPDRPENLGTFGKLNPK